MVEFIRGLVYPFSKTDNIINFLFLAILNALWYFLLPLILVNGYLVKVIRSTVEGKTEMPEWPGFNWSEWGQIIKKGFVYTLIMLIYLAVPFAVAYFGTIQGVSVGVVLLSLLLFLVILFFMPMALVNYAATDSFAQAFNFPEIFMQIFRNIGACILTYVITAALFGITLYISSFAPFFAGFVLIYPILFGVCMLAQILAKAQ
jgi:hypothetical protein